VTRIREKLGGAAPGSAALSRLEMSS